MANYKIEKSYSPHRMGRSGYKPIMIVNHIVEGSYNSCLNWFKNPSSEVSSNFVTSRDGRLAEVIPIKEAAWCNGTSTNPSSSTYYGKALNPIVKAKKTNANYYTVSIEHEGVLRQTGGSLTEEQYQATLWLHKHIIMEVKRIYGYVIPIDRDHITGHKWINPITKPFCPGDKFPFDRLIRDLTLWNYGELKREVNTPIMGEPTASLYQMQKWALSKGADEEFIELADKYIEYSKAYGVDPVITYAQSAKETGFMKFGGVLDKSFKNPCGMKTRAGGGNYDKNAHHRFKSWDDGIRGQAQHLALYAGSKSYPWKTNFDPRNFKSIHGTAPYVEDLGGKWAPSLSYGKDIVKMMGQIKATKVTAEDIKMLQDNYADNLQEVKKIHDSEEAKMPEKDKIVIAYSADGDLANALALFNSLPDASMIRASDATEISKTHKVIQVGGREIKGADIVLAGENRQETLEKISEWVEKQGR